MADMSSDQKDEFKLSFKPSSINMSGNHGSHQQWMSSPPTNNFQNQFMNSSSILLSGFNTNNNNNPNNNNNNNKSNISIFNSMNNNANINTNTSNNNNTNNILNASISHLPTDSEIIFNESVPIIVKTSMTETNTRQLTLKIEKLVQLPQNQHILSITLTDEADPYFLYSLAVNENDFHHLKSDQTLLVDFAVFPKSLVMLLQQCLQCKNKEHPKFVAVLIYNNNNGNGSAILSVQETNQFRHLQHISLKLIPASADRLRQYLGQTLMLYKSETTKLNKLYFDCKQSLQRCKIDKKQAQNYVSEIKQKYEQCLCDLKTSHSSSISLLKQNNLEQIEENRKELLNKKNDLEKELKLQIKTQNLKYNKLKDEFDDLNTNKLTLENKYKNTSEILSVTKQSYENNKKELCELRIECKNLDQLKFKYEKEINQHLINISALKQQILDKSEINCNNTSLLNSQKEQKKSMEQQMKLYKSNLEKSEKKVKECIKEINKGNNIISHLQNEIRNQRNKNKLKEQKLLNMESTCNNNNDDIDKLNEEIKNKSEMVNKYKTDIKELKNTLIGCKDKLQESQKAIESNQRVIAYLNKQLNDNQMNNNIFSSNHNQLLAGMTPSPYATKVVNNNMNNMNNMTSKYQSPYLNKMSGVNTISGLSNMANTATSPILQNTSNKTTRSSYFPQ